MDVVFREMEMAGLSPPQRKNQELLKSHLEVVLLDLYVVYRSDPTRYLAYSRDSRWYSKSKSRYRRHQNRYGYRNIVKVVDFLRDHG